MRTSRKLKQNMFYALYVESTIEYEKDEDGNLIVDYVDEDGNEYYRESGATKPHYADPIQFEASISSKLNEIHAEAYGIDQSSIYIEICVPKNYPSPQLEYGAKVWKDSEVAYNDDGSVDESSSDYTVKGILTEFQGLNWYLLQRNN